MNTRMHPIGMWCKRGAWFVAAIGLISLIVDVYLFVRSSGGVPLSAVLVQLIPPMVAIISNFVFYALILYAVGVVVERFFAYTATQPTTEVIIDETDDLTRSMVEDSVTGAQTSQEESNSFVVEDATLKPTTASADEDENVTIEPTTASADEKENVTI